jgi:alkanesulfonate monooxygenase SsuD/methylene tetrahydromethanopterin reductase-like flavin-dependent oxidoreductase (luciferase family)
MLAVQPQSPGLADRIWWGSGSRRDRRLGGRTGLNLMSSTLLLEDTQVPFDQLQAEQIELFREAWSKAGHTREPRVSVSRSVIPITSDLDRRLFGADANEDQVGWLDGAISRFGRSYTGEPDRIAEELARTRRRSRRHDPPHRAQPARRRLQRRDARDDRPRDRTCNTAGSPNTLRDGLGSKHRTTHDDGVGREGSTSTWAVCGAFLNGPNSLGSRQSSSNVRGRLPATPIGLTSTLFPLRELPA